MSINTKFTTIIALLQANQDKKVSEIFSEALKLAESSKKTKVSLQIKAGKTVAIFCYYHKQWELLADVPYGNKASSTTGYNTMCKCGVRHWTAQNNARKNVASKVLDELTAGTITVEQMTDRKAELLAELSTINTSDKPPGYATLEEVNAARETYTSRQAAKKAKQGK